MAKPESSSGATRAFKEKLRHRTSADTDQVQRSSSYPVSFEPQRIGLSRRAVAAVRLLRLVGLLLLQTEPSDWIVGAHGIVRRIRILESHANLRGDPALYVCRLGTIVKMLAVSIWIVLNWSRSKGILSDRRMIWT